MRGPRTWSETLNEDRYVAAPGKRNYERLFQPFLQEILVESLPQSSSIGAYNVVVPRVVIRGLVEHMHTDLLFSDLFNMPLDIAVGQIVLKHRRDMYPQFRVDNIAANGVVAMKPGEHPATCFPRSDSLTADQLPNENMCSQAVRISYGPFSHYSGGDLTNDTDFGRAPWRDIETSVAKAVGPVTIAVANHHGYVNAMGADAVVALRPQAFIIFAWDSAHPTITPLFNMLSRDLYRGDRRIYGTSVKAENVIATRDIAKMTSTEGHIVVRVFKGGEEFQVLIVEN